MAFGFFKKKNKKELSGSKFMQLSVREVVRETADAVTLVFEQPESGHLTYKPGQFITLVLTIDGRKIRRAYSLCSSSYIGENPAVTVKRVEGGFVSNHINDELRAGAQIEIMEPMGSFTTDIDANSRRQLFLVGGGSGITPLLSIAKSVLAAEKDSRVALVYANRDESSIIFKTAIEQMQREYDGRFAVQHVLESPPAGWSGMTGWLDNEKLRGALSRMADGDYADKSYFVCGPEPMMNIAMDTLEDMGVAEDKKHNESFVAGNTSPVEIIAEEDEAIRDRQVTIVLDGEEHSYHVSAKKTILEEGLDQHIDMPYSCQSGLCTACRGRCVSGKIKMTEDSGLTPEEKEEGYVLLCVGHPITDDVRVEIG